MTLLTELENLFWPGSTKMPRLRRWKQPPAIIQLAAGHAVFAQAQPAPRQSQNSAGHTIMTEIGLAHETG